MVYYKRKETTGQDAVYRCKAGLHPYTGTLCRHRRERKEWMDDAVQIVMVQCELWTDHNAAEQMSKRVEAYANKLMMK